MKIAKLFIYRMKNDLGYHRLILNLTVDLGMDLDENGAYIVVWILLELKLNFLVKVVTEIY